MYMNALLACVYVYHVHAWCLRKSKEAIRSPEPGIMQVCELPCGCWELDPLPRKPLAQPLAFVPAQALTRLPKLVSTRNWGLKPLLTGPNRLFVFLSLSNLFYFHGFNFYLFTCHVQVFIYLYPWWLIWVSELHIHFSLESTCWLFNGQALERVQSQTCFSS